MWFRKWIREEIEVAFKKRHEVIVEDVLDTARSEMTTDMNSRRSQLAAEITEHLRLKTNELEQVRAKVETELQMKIDELAARTVMDSKSAREFTVTTNGGVTRKVKAVRWNITEGMVIAVG